MERLTERIGDTIIRPHSTITKLAFKLADYEDTGLMPYEITKFVVAGKWIEDTFESTITCPICHAKWSMIDNCTETFAHCPNCGARLE